MIIYGTGQDRFDIMDIFPSGQMRDFLASCSHDGINIFLDLVRLVVPFFDLTKYMIICPIHVLSRCIFLCIMAFFYIPGQAADLYRWRQLSEPWMDVSFSWFWENRIISSPTPIGNLLIYICQKTGIDGILPMVCALIFFGNAFHILKCESCRENRNADSIAVFLLFAMSSGRFLEVISGIRCMMAFSIVFRFVYDEIYENRSMLRSIPYYVIAALIHTASIPLIGIRLVSTIFDKKRNTISTVLNAAFAIVVFLIGIRAGEDYIDAGFAKANNYISSDSYSYRWEYIIVILSMTVIVTTLWKFKKRYSEGFAEEKNGVRFLLILLIGEIFTFSTYSIFHRFAAVSIFFSAPVVLTFLNLESKSGRYRDRQTIIVISLVILFLACARGNLCGYKFFLLN